LLKIGKNCLIWAVWVINIAFSRFPQTFPFPQGLTRYTMDYFWIIFGLCVLIVFFVGFIWIVVKGFTLLFHFLSSLSSAKFCPACNTRRNYDSLRCVDCGFNFNSTTGVAENLNSAPFPQPPKFFNQELEEKNLRTALNQIEKLIDRNEISVEIAKPIIVALQNRLVTLTAKPLGANSVVDLSLPNKPMELELEIPVEKEFAVPPLPLPIPEVEETFAPGAEVSEVLPFPKIPQLITAPLPPKTFATLFSGFLENKNILLGELVGGLLIVGGSIALVVTLWNSLGQIPYFPFLMLAGISTLLFFAGQYTLHHWKLQSTSRGMLVIGSLLALLSILVLGNLGVGNLSPLLAGLVQGVALVGIGFLFKKTNEDLFEDSSFAGVSQIITLNLMLSCLAMLIASWFVPLGEISSQIAAVICALLAAFLARLARPKTPAKALLFALLLFFSSSVAQGFILASVEEFKFSYLAIPLVLNGVSLLALRIPDEDNDEDSFAWAGPIIHGSGVLLMTLAPLIAWPNPFPMVNAFWLAIGLFFFLNKTAVPFFVPLAICLQLIIAICLQSHLLNGTLQSSSIYTAINLCRILIEAPSAFAILLVGIVATTFARLNSTTRAACTGWITGTWFASFLCLAMGWWQVEGPGAGGALAQLVFAFLLFYLYKLQPNRFTALAVSTLPISAAASFMYPEISANIGISVMGFIALVYAILTRIIFSPSDKSPYLKQSFAFLSVGLIVLLLPAWLFLAKAGDDFPFLLSLGCLELGIASILLAWKFKKVELSQAAFLFWAIASFTFFQNHLLFPMPYSAALLGAVSLALLCHLLNSFFIFFDSAWDEAVYVPAQIAEFYLLILVPFALVIESGYSILSSKVLDLPLAIYLDWFAFAALMRALLVSSIPWFRVFQISIAGSVGCLSLLWVRSQPWFLEQGGNINHPWVLQTLGCWVSTLALIWSILRFEARKTKIFRDLWFETRRSIDEWTLAALCSALLGLGLFSCFLASINTWGLLPVNDWPTLMMGQGILIWYALLFTTCVIYLWDEASYPKLVLFHLLIAFGFILLGYHCGGTNIPLGVNLSLAAWFVFGSVLLCFHTSLNAFCGKLTIRVQEGNLPERALRWNIAGFALVVLTWKLAEDIASLIGESGAIQFQLVQYWAPLALLILGLFIQVFSEKNQRFLFHIQWLVMAGAGVGTIRFLHQSSQLDKGAIVILPQMMALVGGLFLWVWFILRRFVDFKFADYPSRATLSVGSLTSLAIILGLMRLNNSVSEAHIFTLEAGSFLAIAMLACVLSGCLVLRLQEFGTLYWRNLFLAGLGVIATTSCFLERKEPLSGIKFLVIAGPLYSFLCVWAYLIRNLFSHRISRIDFSSLRELASFLQGLSLYLLFLIFWSAWYLGLTNYAQIALAFLIATSILLAWFRSSDRHSAIAFWLSCAFGVLVVFHYHKAESFELWYAVMISWLVCAGAIYSALWVHIKPLNQRWFLKSQVSDLEASHLLLPWLALLLLLLPTGFNFILAGDDFVFPNWLVAMSGLPMGFALLFSLVANLGYRNRANLSTDIIWTGSILNFGIFAGLCEFQRLNSYKLVDFNHTVSFSYALLTLVIIWILFGLLISSTGLVLRCLNKSFSFLDQNQWPTNLNFLMIPSCLVIFRIATIQTFSPWIIFSLISFIALQLATIAAWRNLIAYAYTSLFISFLAFMYLGWAFQLHQVLDLVHLACLGLGTISLFWVLVSFITFSEIKRLAVQMVESAMQIALVMISISAGGVYFSALVGTLLPLEINLSYTTIAILSVVSITGYLTQRLKFGDLGLFILGLSAISIWLRSRNLIGSDLIQASCIPVALFTSFLCALFLVPLNLPRPTWLAGTQGTLSGIIFLISGWIAWNAEIIDERLIGSLGTILVAPSALFLAWAGLGTSRSVRREFLFLLAAGWCFFLQAIPSPLDETRWPVRAALLQVSFLTLVIVGRIFQSKLVNQWEFAAKMVRDRLPILAFLSFPLTIIIEAYHFDSLATKSLQTDWAFQLTFVSALIFALGSLRLAFMLKAPNDREVLWQNTKYTWGVIGFLIGLFLHTRLCNPEWFGGKLAQYWSLIILALSFLSAGFSDLLYRRNKQAIAQPIMATGVLIPLVPLLAFWGHQYLISYPTQFTFLKHIAEVAQKLPFNFGTHAFLWFLTAMVWGWVAMQRNSIYLGLVSCFGLVAGFWALWQGQGFSFLQHPQMWLIPPALFLLILEQSMRQQFSVKTSQFLRYFGLTLIYVSSCADLLILGIGYSIWLPVALAFWSVVGVLAGMLTRTKVFLFFGMGFLLLDILMMIWYAAVDKGQTWIWWVAVIVLGSSILGIFTLFEKRKNDIKILLEKIKSWH